MDPRPRDGGLPALLRKGDAHAQAAPHGKRAPVSLHPHPPRSCVLFILTTTSQVGLAGGSGMYSAGVVGRHIGLAETAVPLAVYAVLSRTVLAGQLENSLTARLSSSRSASP